MQETREYLEQNDMRQEIIDRLTGSEGQELSNAFQRRRKQLLARAEETGAKVEIRETRNIRRNDPCPCGSGVKFKKCCGKRLAVDDDRIKD